MERSKQASVSFHVSSCAFSRSAQTLPLPIGMSKGFLFSLSLCLWLQRCCWGTTAAVVASSWLTHTTSPLPESLLQQMDRKIHVGNAGSSVHMPTSFCHQLNLSLLCSAPKQQSRSPPCPPTPQLSFSPGYSSSLAPRVAHGYGTNKTLAAVSAGEIGNPGAPQGPSSCWPQ